jgi:VWFA-related protein
LSAPPQASFPTLSVRTELVSVPVVVKDSRGHHIQGLSGADFRVYENGHLQAIRSFETVTGNAAPTVSDLAHLSQAGSGRLYGGLGAVILFFDQVNTPTNEQLEVRHLLARSYGERQRLPVPTCVILYTGSELRLLAQPTTDPATVGAAIAKIQTTITARGAGMSGELPLPAGARENQVVGDAKLEQDRAVQRFVYYTGRAITAGDTAQALTSVGRFFAPWSGEKVLIWITAGTTIPIPTAELAADRVRVYPLNVHNHMPYMFTSTFTVPVSTYEYETEVNRELLQNMRSAAEETGGELCNDSLQPEACVRSAEQDASEFYLLSYATHSGQKRAEWRTIHVTVQRPGVRVFARTGVLIETHPDPIQEKQRQLQAALLSPVEFSALSVEAVLPEQGKSGSAITVLLVMRSDAQRPPLWSDTGVNFTVAGVVLQGLRVVQRFGEDVRGPLPIATERELEKNGLAWSKRIRLLPGTATLRLVVRDNNTGRLGSVTEALPARTTVQ